MTEKEMIEEMAKVMCGNDCEECAKETAQWRGCSLKKAKAEECLIKKEAKLLYNAGYRKIPKGSVVLSKEKYEGKEIVVEMSGGHKLRLTVGKFGEMSRVLEESTRKETAKEILSLAIKHDDGYETDMPRFIDDLKKQYGVEE